MSFDGITRSGNTVRVEFPNQVIPSSFSRANTVLSRSNSSWMDTSRSCKSNRVTRRDAIPIDNGINDCLIGVPRGASPWEKGCGRDPGGDVKERENAVEDVYG